MLSEIRLNTTYLQKNNEKSCDYDFLNVCIFGRVKLSKYASETTISVLCLMFGKESEVFFLFLGSTQWKHCTLGLTQFKIK